MSGSGSISYIGPFLFGSALFAVSAIVYLTLLRPDPLVVIGGDRRLGRAHRARSARCGRRTG